MKIKKRLQRRYCHTKRARKIAFIMLFQVGRTRKNIFFGPKLDINDLKVEINVNIHLFISMTNIQIDHR